MLLAFTPSEPHIFVWLWSFAGNVAPAFCVTQGFQKAYLFQPFELHIAVILKMPTKAGDFCIPTFIHLFRPTIL
jgi:hypothetical protein